jgi:cysteinyl-tRNA synthetase
MALRLYNTLTSQLEPFAPAEPGHVRLYVCGPTVYDFAHVGHARCYVVYDILVRHLRASGLKVTFVRNVTDIDDKILARAKERGETPLELSERFRVAYVEDMRRLGNVDPDVEPKVSDHLGEIETMITRLIEKGAAYASGGDVYFRVSAFPEYGKLSHRRIADLESGASGRLDEVTQDRKEHAADFALWKGSEPGEQSWPSPWGNGRPGWHIECSAMSSKYLGETFDLHGGGLDLVFPHHENELAQSEAASGKPFVRHWMHNGFVEVSKEKMSKSLGNFFTVRDLFARVEPEAIRWFIMTTGYRGPVNFDWENDAEGRVARFPSLEEAEARVEYLYSTMERLSQIPEAKIAENGKVPSPELARVKERLAEALDDDLNLPVALSRVAEFLGAVNELTDRTKKGKQTVSPDEIRAATDGLREIQGRLGLGTQDVGALLLAIRDRRARSRGIDAARVESLLLERAAARTQKDFQKADQVRDALTQLGVELLDTPSGTTWRVPAVSSGI